MLLFREKVPADWSPKVMATFYAGLVESEGNHYATYLLMAKAIDEHETDRRLDFYLDLDAKLIRQPNELAILH
jgi:tRNA-(ms[2]io[6]A)-hydroxylase